MRKDRTIKFFSSLFCILFVALPASAAQYECIASKMFASGDSVDLDRVKKGKFSVKLEEGTGSTTVQRCSFARSVGKVTCDAYEVDKIQYDENIKAKKYYVFRSQYDLQIYSNLSFVENNGRSGIAFGDCAIVSP